MVQVRLSLPLTQYLLFSVLIHALILQRNLEDRGGLSLCIYYCCPAGTWWAVCWPAADSRSWMCAIARVQGGSVSPFFVLLLLLAFVCLPLYLCVYFVCGRSVVLYPLQLSSWGLL